MNSKTPYEQCLEADAKKPRVIYYREFVYTIVDKKLTVERRCDVKQRG